jgi:hypothetical protein
MLRLFRLTAISVFGLSMVMAAVRWIGGTQPLSLAAWFTNPDGTPCPYPCLFGIRPGVTRYEDALALIRSHPVTRHMRLTPSSGSQALQINDDSVAFFVYRDRNNRVESIFTTPSYRNGVTDLPLGLGDVIAVLGIPDSIPMRDSQNLPTSFAYPELGISFSAINWNSPYMDLSQPYFAFSVGQRWSEQHPDAVPWVGFGSRERYVRQYGATHNHP